MDFQGLKIRQTDILKRVEGSLRSHERPDAISVHLRCTLADTAVWMDGEAIERMLVELEKNAFEAMAAGGSLSIAIEGDNDRISILIEDNGRGILPKHLDMLFTPFFSTKPVGEGSGLGLSYVYGTVKAHGGSVAIESNANPQQGLTGTKVRITLPRRSFMKDPEANLILHDD